MIKFVLRVPEELHATIEKLLSRTHRSMNMEIVHAIEYYLKHSPEAQPEEDQIKKKPIK